MTVRPIRALRRPGSPRRSAPIDHIDDGVRALVRDLIDTVELPGRAGVAAPQIGVGPARLQLQHRRRHRLRPQPGARRGVGRAGAGRRRVPVGARVSGTTRCGTRGPRSSGIDLDGNEVVLEGEGLLAQALQHETDHLDGKLYLERLPRRDAPDRDARDPRERLVLTRYTEPRGGCPGAFCVAPRSAERHVRRVHRHVVELFDLGGVVVHDDVALDAHLRREVTARLGPLGRRGS